MSTEKNHINDFSIRLRKILKALQLNQKEFSERLGRSTSGFSHVINGERLPNIEFLFELHKHFPQISLLYLLTGEGGITTNAGDAMANETSAHYNTTPNVKLLQETIEIQRELIQMLKKQTQDADTSTF